MEHTVEHCRGQNGIVAPADLNVADQVRTRYPARPGQSWHRSGTQRRPAHGAHRLSQSTPRTSEALAKKRTQQNRDSRCLVIPPSHESRWAHIKTAVAHCQGCVQLPDDSVALRDVVTDVTADQAE